MSENTEEKMKKFDCDLKYVIWKDLDNNITGREIIEKLQDAIFALKVLDFTIRDDSTKEETEAKEEVESDKKCCEEKEEDKVQADAGGRLVDKIRSAIQEALDSDVCGEKIIGVLDLQKFILIRSRLSVIK